MILDTSILVDAERGRFELTALLRAHPGQSAAIAAVTASELLRGVERAIPSTLQRRSAFVEYLFTRFDVLPYSLATARVQARAWADLERMGALIGPHGLIIAATALEIGSAVATLNRREFERVPGPVLADVQPYVVAR